MSLRMGGGFLFFILSFIFDLQMFDRIKRSDEASASSAQGKKIKVHIFYYVNKKLQQ